MHTLNSTTIDRNTCLDITKGLLVIIMLISHSWGSIAHLTTAPDVRYSITFVTSSFVFISGLIFGNYLLPKYIQNPYIRFKRDSIHALKLYLIFLLPNLILYFLNYREISTTMSFSNWALSLLMHPKPDLPVFEIIYSIALVMFFSSLGLYSLSKILGSNKKNHLILGVIAFATGVLLINLGILNRLTGFGLLGLAYGIMITNSYSKIIFKNNLYYLAIGFILLMISISYAFSLGQDIFGPTYLPYVATALTGIYFISRYLSTIQFSSKILGTIGKHSLFLYLYQVLLTRAIYMTLVNYKNITIDIELLFFSITIAVGVTMILIAFSIEKLSLRHRKLQLIYNAIFR